MKGFMSKSRSGSGKLGGAKGKGKKGKSSSVLKNTSVKTYKGNFSSSSKLPKGAVHNKK